MTVDHGHIHVAHNHLGDATTALDNTTALLSKSDDPVMKGMLDVFTEITHVLHSVLEQLSELTHAVSELESGPR